MIREFNEKMDEKASTIKLSEGNSQPSSLVRPSSLNYKISLSEAVLDFIKKDMPVAEDQIIDDENLMTETLARIYVEQNNYDKAIQSYQILSLKYPEKSSLFAIQIESIKVLKKNNL